MDKIEKVDINIEEPIEVPTTFEELCTQLQEENKMLKARNEKLVEMYNNLNKQNVEIKRLYEVLLMLKENVELNFANTNQLLKIINKKGDEQNDRCI